MLSFIVRRVVIMIPTLFFISVISFAIINAPPGDILSVIMAQQQEMGQSITQADIEHMEAMRVRYGLDRPIYEQYGRWITRIITQGDFGHSFNWNRPVSRIIRARFLYTLILVFSAMVFMFVVAFPVGFISAVKRYTFIDHFFTFFGFLGLAIPNFLFALVMLYLGYQLFGTVLGGFFSRELADAPWSIARVLDLARHLIVPTIVLGTAGTAGLIRIMRNNLLDELEKPYVMTARAKGVTYTRLLLKYPVRVAINPFLSTVGWLLPDLFSGAIVTSVVLSLPTFGPAFLESLQSQDMYLAGSFVLLFATMTVIGTLISDVLLAIADPRIRYDKV